MRLMPEACEELCRDATAAEENRRRHEPIKPHFMHAQVYHNLIAWRIDQSPLKIISG